jgi:crotonobetaine/carnitine-CoA ligase
VSQPISNPTEVLRQRAHAAGDEEFLFFEDQRITLGKLDDAVNRAAAGFLRLGLGRRDGIAIFLANRPQWLYAFFAAQRIGAYVVPINVSLLGEGLAYILDHSEAKFAVVGWELVEPFSAVRHSVAALRRVIVDTTGAPREFKIPAGSVPLSDLLDMPAGEVGSPPDPDAVSTIMYTSGTTGLPKGVVMRYRAMNLDDFTPFARLAYRPGDILYTCLPLFHGNALFLTVFRALGAGLRMALGHRFSASRFWDEIRRHGATSFNALGAMIPILLKQPPRPDDAENPVRLVLSAGTPAWAWQEFERRFAVTLWEGYGAVDGGGFFLFNMGTAPKGSMGKAPPGTDAKVVDDEGREVPTGEVGNLIFKVDDPAARSVEYFKNPQASAKKIRDGWFFTGDLASRDAEGNFYFADRKTDSMRRRGENISSFEVEKIVTQHPAVLECAAFGVPAELGEDDVMVAIVPKAGQSIAPQELVRFCRDRMAYFMVPRYVDVRASLPKTETHRVQKALLKKAGVTPTTWDGEKATTADSRAGETGASR